MCNNLKFFYKKGVIFMIRIGTDNLFLVNNILGPIDPGQWIRTEVCKVEGSYSDIDEENCKAFKLIKRNVYDFIIEDLEDNDDENLDGFMVNTKFNVSVLPSKRILSKPIIKIFINGEIDNRVANTLYNDKYDMDTTCEMENDKVYYYVIIWRYNIMPIVKIFKEVPGYDHKDYLELAIKSTLDSEENQIFDSLDENYRLVRSIISSNVLEQKDARITSWYYDIVDSLGEVIYSNSLKPILYINEEFKYKIDILNENAAILYIGDNEENYTPLAELNINKIGVPYKIAHINEAAKLTEEGYVYESCGYRYILEIDEAGIAYFGIEDIESGDLMLISNQYRTVYCEDKISTEYMLRNDGAINYNLNRGRLVVEQIADNQFVGSPIHSKDFFIAHTFAGIPVRIF